MSTIYTMNGKVIAGKIIIGTSIDSRTVLSQSISVIVGSSSMATRAHGSAKRKRLTPGP